MHLLLIGPRASGKTTVGRELAAMMNRDFVDLDAASLSLLGRQSVREVWEQFCESIWRKAEAEVLAKLLADLDHIIALGGGTPMIPAAREAIDVARRNGRAYVIYLRCSPAVLMARLRSAPGDRPSITGADPADEIAAVLAEREPMYLAIADEVVDCDEQSPEKIARTLAASRGRKA